MLIKNTKTNISNKICSRGWSPVVERFTESSQNTSPCCNYLGMLVDPPSPNPTTTRIAPPQNLAKNHHFIIGGTSSACCFSVYTFLITLILKSRVLPPSQLVGYTIQHVPSALRCSCNNDFLEKLPEKRLSINMFLAYVLATNRNSHWSHHYIIILIPPTFQQPKKNSDPTPLILFLHLLARFIIPPLFLVGSNQKHHQNPWPFARLLVLHLDSLKLVLLHLPVHIRPVYLREKEPWEFPCICRDRVYVLCKKKLCWKIKCKIKCYYSLRQSI